MSNVHQYIKFDFEAFYRARLDELELCHKAFLHGMETNDTKTMVRAAESQSRALYKTSEDFKALCANYFDFNQWSYKDIRTVVETEDHKVRCEAEQARAAQVKATVSR